MLTVRQRSAILPLGLCSPVLACRYLCNQTCPLSKLPYKSRTSMAPRASVSVRVFAIWADGKAVQ